MRGLGAPHISQLLAHEDNAQRVAAQLASAETASGLVVQLEELRANLTATATATAGDSAGSAGGATGGVGGGDVARTGVLCRIRICACLHGPGAPCVRFV